jgi:hypothetical protein
MPSAHRIGLSMGSMGVSENSLEGWRNEQSPVTLVA